MTRRLPLNSILIVSILTACTPLLVGPAGPDSALVFGRVVVDSKFPGGLSGLLPIGVLDKGLDVEIESRDGKQNFRVTTQN